MIYVSVLLPAFTVDSEEDIPQAISQHLKIPHESYDIIELPSTLKEYCLRLNGSSTLNLSDLDRLINENRQLTNQLERCKESIRTLNVEFNYVLNNPSVPQDLTNQKLLKAVKKVKTLKEDNKKLRQMLKAQLDNSEKMRIEMETTIETLREEFDLLVKELISLQRKDANQELTKVNLTKLIQKQNESFQAELK